MTPGQFVKAYRERFTSSDLREAKMVYDFVEPMFAQARAEALREAIKAIEAEHFHVVTQDQVDVLVAAKARFIAAIRALGAQG